ncbi:MAG: ATP-binding cassette domain-containing protein [Candidatus Omnitrophota bacterium]
MISVQNLNKRYGDQTLFEDVAFTVNPGEKIGVVGRNGHGKTTLFRLITGEEESDGGKIIVPRNYRTGYLTQHISFSKPTVIEEGCRALQPDRQEDKWKVEKILSGLGFADEDFPRDPAKLSGGYQVRLNLAKILISEPDMLLLDEPTNFLDIISIRWLEDFLKKWRGELFVISHDRSFMDSVTTHILGIHRKSVKKIKGPTKNYYEQVEKEEAIYEKQRLNDEKKRRMMMDHINRFRAKARHASQAQSHLKSVDKMEKMEKLERIRSLGFSFNTAPFESRYVLEARGLSFSYDGKPPYLIDKFDLTVERHDKICVIGKNGKGKTTLMRILASRYAPLKGHVHKHPAVREAYFEQANTAALHNENTIEQELSSCLREADKNHVRNVCGAMMFSGDDALKKISVLSGGERSRVLLGKTLLSSANLLLLDEPTHHLDMESCEAIIDAVSSFPGAAIVVTHDENFMRKVATKLLVFQSGRVLVYPGGYDDFLEQVGWNEQENRLSVNAFQEEDTPENKLKKEDRKARAEFVALRAKTLKPYLKKIEDMENEIDSKEKDLSRRTEMLVTASEKQDGHEISKLSKAIHDLKQRIDALYDGLGNTMEEYEKEKKRFE